MMSRLGWGLLMLSLVGCTSSDVGGGSGEGISTDTLDCAPGEVRDCACDDGSIGEQQCLTIGQGFEPCVCGELGGGDTSTPDEEDTADSDGVGPGEEQCSTDLDCDDGIPCTVDVCQNDDCNNILPAGYCVIDETCVGTGSPNPNNPCEACDPNSGLFDWKARHDLPCDDGDPCTTNDTCDKDVCHGQILSCDDGLYCNGEETCDSATGCLPGEPAAVDDGVACTLDTCDEDSKSVIHTPDDSLCFPSDSCSLGACDAAVGCYNVPLPTCCGNGVVEPGEDCDDGNDDEDDGCSMECKDTSVPPAGDAGCPLGQVSILMNPGFEDGVLQPWTSNGANTTVVNAAFEGAWAAETNGNVHVAQSFPPVPVAQLTLASFWTWHEPGAGGIMSIEWAYADGSTGNTFLGDGELDDWTQIHLLALMDATKELVSIQTWGYSGGGDQPDIARFDGYQFCLGDGDICIPDCGGATCGDDGCGGSCGECAGGPDTCVDGQCLCVPDCGGATCGDDGCGGSCGECDGATPLCMDGTCAEFPPTLPACEDDGISVLHNPGFEDGVLEPWTSNGANTTVVNAAFEGAWAAETNGNVHVAQSFPPVPVAQLITASFWTWHTPGDSAAMSVEWTYSDGSTGSAYVGSSELDGWIQVQLLDQMDTTKELVSIQTWGYSGGGDQPDIVRYDGYQFCAAP